MRKIFFSICILFFLVSIFFGLTLSRVAADDVNVGLTVLGCNNNTMCEANLGEDQLSCPADCGAPPPPPILPSSGGGGSSGAGMGIKILFFQSDIGATTARFRTDTNIVTNATISWGETFDFELGTQTSVGYALGHEMFLQGLKPNTRYYYRIVHRSELGGSHEFIQEFVTTATPDTTPPQNIWELSATPYKDRIELIWRNPPDVDFEKVIIVRSPQFYPQDPYEGKIVYEGGGHYVTDTDFQPGKIYYYTLFAIDEDGNYSSGAIVRVVVPTASGSTPQIPPQIPQGGLEYSSLKLSDFLFFQAEKPKNVEISRVKLEADGTFLVKLPELKLPKGDHILLFTAIDPDTKKEYSFMMRHATTTFEYATSVYFQSKPGSYPMTINVYDTQHKLMTTIQGFLDFQPSDFRYVNMIERLSKWISFLIALALILPLLFIVFLWIVRLLRML